MANNEPMTDERLQTIRERIYGDSAWEHDAGIANDVLLDRLALLHEVERQRGIIAEQQEQLAAMRPMVEAVACSNPYGSWLPATNTPPGVVCRWCMERAQSSAECQHDHECNWRQARAYLAAHPEQLAAETLEREGE